MWCVVCGVWWCVVVVVCGVWCVVVVGSQTPFVLPSCVFPIEKDVILMENSEIKARTKSCKWDSK